MDNLEVKFYDTVNDELLKFAVIISRSNGKWVFCKHKERDTYEVPGGHSGVLPVNRTIKNNKFLYRQPNYGWRYFYATFVY